MKIGKGFWIFIGGLVVGVFLGICFATFMTILLESTKPLPPRVAGVAVPAKTYEIDFSKRYNLTLESGRDFTTYTSCLIKGFTQGKRESSLRYEYFNTWLVVELPDGRVVYFPPRNIVIIEEAKQSGS